MIELTHLHKFFNKGKQNEIHVINDISLSLPDRGMVAIFGRSGCGKTTLLNVIGGLDRFESGSLTVDGQSIRSDTDTIRNRYIGYIFQNYNLSMEETCYNNVADALRLCGMADGKEMEERVVAALSNVGMEHYASRTPDTLSGGQQQRIAIARAIVKNPRIILADEPTGNLDESNTLMIMNLLKQIAKDHLVLLVTHEANLVDYYCDTVVELQDGAVVSVRQNEGADGFAAKDKNHIYLGELPESTCGNSNVDVSYYGDAPEAPVKVKIVNHGGKLYVRIDTPRVQLLDDTSEVKLKDGVYESKPKKDDVSNGIDMSKLPPVVGTRFGRLFSLKASLKSGYAANFKKGKRSRAVLRRCMSLFAAVLVFMTAYFGTVIGDLLNAQAAYNHNVFYLYSSEPEVSAKINSALGSHGIDYLYLKAASYHQGDESLRFYIGAFETFDAYTDISTNAVVLGAPLIASATAVAGKNTPGVGEMILSTAVADTMLEKSPVGYISSYADLIGLVCSNVRYNEQNLRVAGVVESDETAVYISEVALANRSLESAPYSDDQGIVLDESLGISVEPGKTVLITREGLKLPAIGESISVRGQKLQISGIVQECGSYESYLAASDIKKETLQDYFAARGITDAEDIDKAYYQYFDYYFAEAGDYMLNRYLCYPGEIDTWLFVEKEITQIQYLYVFAPDISPEEYYAAVCYKAANGVYPSRSELQQAGFSDSIYAQLKQFYMLYEEEFYDQKTSWPQQRYRLCYVVSSSDYVALARQVGDYSITLSGTDTMEDPLPDDPSIPEIEVKEKLSSYATYGGMTADVIVDVEYFRTPLYAVIHSSDPEATAAFLTAEFGELESPAYMDALITPQDIFDGLIADARVGILISLVTMAVIFAIMSLCMYFIMRSSLMNRIKEVGIYRAIGVSKRNLTFKFFIEAIVLTSLTVLVGFVICSAFIFACFGISPLVESFLFYPPWMALILLVLLYLLCIICGVLPILGLLRKTPSEILAKYDI